MIIKNLVKKNESLVSVEFLNLTSKELETLERIKDFNKHYYKKLSVKCSMVDCNHCPFRSIGHCLVASRRIIFIRVNQKNHSAKIRGYRSLFA